MAYHSFAKKESPQTGIHDPNFDTISPNVAYHSVTKKESNPHYEIVNLDEVSVNELSPNRAYGIVGTSNQPMDAETQN